LSLQIAQFEEQVRGMLAQQQANHRTQMVEDDLDRLTPLSTSGSSR
jgi:hypothetical protein